MSHHGKRLVKFLDRMPSPQPEFSLEEPVDTLMLSLSFSLTFSINGPSLSQLH